MSTEQQSLTTTTTLREPGASPTAAAAATDKRPRGRPRKDGASPFQRVRKKPRNRGKSTVEDEDSMDGLEATETENTVEVDTREQFTEEDGQSEVDDDKKATPDLQCSVSVDSANTNCSIGVEAKSSSEQVCAFCYCGERSSLGQGELKQFSPTPGFIAPWNNQPLNINETVDSNDTIDESIPRQNPVLHKARGQKKEQNITTCTCISIEATPDDQVVKVWDELRMVGLPDDIDVQALFEPTGYCWAHHRCAEWSLEVCQTEEQLPANVDKAVVSGSTKQCAYCKHLGATIKCCEEKCTHIYHYPCAAGAGTFQDFNNFSLLCPDHIDQAPQRSKEEANCAVCDSPGDLLDQLFCTTCGQHYHGMCLDIQVTPIKRAGWQCPDCKVCQNCKQSGEDNKMLVCDTCDKGYHTFCLQPVMDSVPTNGWKCKNCRVCAECGTRISSQWHHNCLMCDSCYRQQDNLPCPFCEKSPYPNLQKERLHCHMCKRWIHIGCDKPPDNELDIHLKDYICSLCKHSDVDQEHTQMCEMMETEQLLPEVDTDDIEMENIVSEDIRNQMSLVPEGGLDQELVIESSTDNKDALSLTAQDHICLSLDEKKYELETQVSNHFDTEEGEKSVKNTPVSDSNPSDKKRETPENIPETTQQESDKQAEETKPLETSTELVEAPQEECQLLQMEQENISKITETFILVGREPISSPKEEQSETVAVLGNTNGRDTPEVSPLPQSESCATESCQLADKPSESSPEMFSPRPSSVEISKPVGGSSLPTSSLEPSASHEMLRCQMLSLESAAVLPTTFVPFTPKIGMGKPAITKRKFSPGRPRSRQGTWNSHNTASPPSWSQDILESREVFKSRQLPGSAIWSIKVGRGSGFPGKRRPRGAGLSGRGGRGRSKLKNGIGSILAPGVTDMDNFSNKDEEENSMHNTVVLFSSSDKFTLHQDMCVVCGSFGQGAEGQLLACSQCGQCYHPFCVGIKITKVVLHKGWRCLECTVCEACGKATDPGRLLLCDDCDISYHTYCLDPPLQTVPKGGWKCKWCVWCRHCGATSPGLRCEWQNNYTQCAPCASLSTCPVCCCNYREEELIVQCRQCDRWMHTVCQNLNTEEEVENTADNGFDCTMCRPYMPSANVPSFEFCESSIAAQIPLKAKELDPPKTYTQDGVCLTETGMSQLQSLSAIVPRRKRAKPKLKLKIINQNSVAVLQTPCDVQSEHSRDGEMDDSREGDLMDCEGKSDTSPEREPIDDDPKGMEATEGIKKRKRKPYRPGIGGFMVRQRSRTGQGKMKRSLSRKDSSGSVSEHILSRDESWSEQLPDTLVDETMSISENMEKMKKRYRKKKNKLEEIFPAYLQEAFFGKELLDTSKQSKPRLDNLCDKRLSIPCKASLNTNFLDPSSDPLLSSTSTSTPSKSGAQGTLDDPLAALVLNTEDDILGILSDDLVKPGDHSAGLDIGPISHDPSTSLPLQNISQSTRPLSEEQLDGILSPELDKMVTDGAILGKLYKIPELGGKDVEDLFTAVLSPAATQSAPLPQPPPPPPSQLMHLHNQGENAFSRIPLMNGLIGQTSHLPHTPLVPGGGLGTFSTITQPSYTDTRDKNTVFNTVINDPTNPWVATATPLEGENDTMSNAQRSTLKWEKEEALGEMATVAPVLYTNINFPNLKEEFPDWTTRVKQIAKLWRKASSQERAPYVQKARDNRAALRINKVQMSNDSMKRQQQQDNIDPGSRIETDLFKDPLKQRESEHEQEWKFRQQMRQKSKQQAKIEATQKLEQVKNEQQQQQQLQQQQLGSQQLVNHSGSDTPSSGMQSPLTPQTSNGNISPAQQALYAKQLPGPSTATPSDVFLKPQAPPPPVTANRMPAQDGHCQTPSQQTFSSSPSAQPPSPVDPYAKMVGTPRPPPVNQNQKFVRRNSATSAEVCPLPSISRPTQVSESMGRRPSPARDSCSLSPGTSDPYAKPPDTPRPVIGTEQFSKPLGMSRSPLISEQPASSDQFAKPPPRTGCDTFQRPRIPSTDSCLRPSLTSTSVIEGHSSPFKTPACPNLSPQDSYTKMPPALRRVAVDPYERPLLTPRPVDSFAHNPSNDSYSQSQLASHAIKDTFAHPQRVLRNQGDYSGALSRTVAQDPYAQPPGTPRPATDPYAQPPGTPRPASDLYAQPPGTPRPASDLYAQPPGTPRPASDLYAQPPGTPRPASDLYAQPPGTPRPASDLYAQPPGTPRPASDLYAQPPGTPRPASDLYAQPPGTPRPASDLYAQPPGTPRPASDLYAQPPGTPRPASDLYAQPPGTPRPASDLYAQPPGTPRPVSVDPYMHQPLASRPPQAADLFAQVSANQRHSDLYAQPPGTPMPVTNDPYSQSPATQRSGISETFSRPISMSNRDPYLQASQSRTLSGTFVKPSDPSQPSKLSGSTVTDSFSHDSSPCDPFDQPPMTPRPQPETFGTAQHPQDDQSRSGSEGNFNSSVNSSMNLQGKLFSQTAQGSVTGPTAGLTQNSTMSHTDAEKLRQRQKLREIILQQQQQKKNAIRQEKGPPEPPAATQAAPIQPWKQENLNQIFTRPPPPYPGNIRSSTIPPGGLRLAGFPIDGQLNRPQFPGDAVGMGMRPHGIRFGFPSGGHGPPPCQDHFLGPPQQMQHAGVPPQFRRSMPIDLPRLPNKPPMNNPIALSQHFPPQGIQVQQHNIMGQAFIELCHRAPEVRPRLPFISSPTTIMNTVPEHQQQTELLPRQDRQGPRHLEPTRCNSQNPDNPLQSSTSLEYLAPSQQDKMNPTHPPALVLCSLNHPLINNAFSGGSLPTTRPTGETNDLQVPRQPRDTLEEKLDPDVKDLDVKDLDGVEVKDLVDEDLENLNLDAEDKGDELDTLDNLETNDRHLDDLLRSGEFDIIAYTDPDHDLGDKKGMFNEELDLNVPIDDIQGKAEDSLQKHSDDKTSVPEVSVPPQEKAAENSETKTEVLSPIGEATCNHEKIDKNVAASSAQHDGESKPVLPCKAEATDKANMNEETAASSSDAVQLPSQNTTNSCNTPGSTPVLTSLLSHGNSENPDTRLLDSPSHSFRTTQTNPVSSIPQTLITSTSQNMENVLPDVNMVPPVSHSFSQGTAVNSGFISGQPLNPSLGVGQPGSQTGPVVNRPPPSGIPGPQQLVLSQTLIQQQNRERPLLLEEQPLLLQDLLDQERQEQQQQRQMQAMIRQRSEPFFPNIDFDAITDPIMKAKMVALKGINKVMAQNNMGMPPLVMNRFAFMGQTGPGAQSSEGQHLIPQAVTQDGSLTPQISRPNPPNFGPGFVNDSYRKQYEEWLQETQQLLQMQQKYLEEQIGAHRKSKKALSAKQRTAKKAGREFPEEDAEQLKHVTEQQSMVQKQLEQIRKQQKEHAELIEEYRIKQQQSGMGPHSGMPGLASQPPMVPGRSSPAVGQQNFPMISQQLQHPQHTVGQPNPPRIPCLPSWQPPNTPVLFSHNAPRMPPPIPQLPVNPGTPASVLAPSPSVQSGPPPRVEFEDNNPFSESFQERERKERLREQQERQRIQLMQEVDRQRALQQRIEMEQHGTVSSELNARTSFPQIPYLGSDRPCDFMRPPQPLQQSLQQPPLPPPPPPPPLQQQIGSILQPGPLNSPPTATFPPCSEQQQAGASPFASDSVPVQGGSSAYHSAKQSHGSISGVSFTQSLARPQFATGVPAVSPGTSSGPACGQDSSLPPGTNFAGTNPTNQSLIQLYSDIIPEEKGKKKRTRKKKKEDDADSVNTPSTPHSDITAPPTPVVVDAVSTPTLSTPGELARNSGETEKEELPDAATPNAAEGQSSLELKAQLAESNLPQNQLPEPSSLNPETDTVRTDISASLQEIRPEKAEVDQCSSQAESKMKTERDIDMEDDKTAIQLSPPAQNLAPPVNTAPAKVDSGNELLKHLLKNKTATSHISQKSDSSFHFPENAEENKLTEKQELAESSMLLGNPLQGSLSCGNSQVQRADLGHEMKKQRNKRTQRTGEKATSRPKRKKKEEEEKQTVFPNTEAFMQLKQQLSLLPLMEPMIGMSFTHFLPYGSSHQSSGSRLVGAFGSATLDGVSDYYSQLIYKDGQQVVIGDREISPESIVYGPSRKQQSHSSLQGLCEISEVDQNNLSNPPTPPASLPPTPPPVTCQKIVNGFATTEELATKAGMLGGPDALGSKQFQLPFRPQDDLLARAIIQGPKSVDVPASLPTPPHNNHEELRIQDPCDDRESPDSFVPSSSPESVMGMEISRYPDLSAVKEEMPQSAPSPVIPILPASTGKGSEAKQSFIKMEPCSTFFSSQLGLAPNITESGLVSIAITLHPTAAENIGSVVAAFSNLLRVRIPNSYEISTSSAVPSSIGIMNPHRTNPAFEYRQHVLLHGPQPGTFGPPGLTGPYGLKPHNAPFLSSGNVLSGYKAQSPNVADGSALRSQWCSHCKVVVLGSGVRKSFKELHFLKQDSKEKSERIEKDIVFCSNNCLVLYSASMQAKSSESKESAPPEIQFPMKEPPKCFHQYSTNISTFDVHCLPQLQEKNSPPSSPLIIFPPAFEAAKVEPKPEELRVTVKLKPRLRTVPNGLDDCRPVSKKWKGMKWKKWNVQIVIPKGTFKPVCEEEIDELLKKLGTTLKPDPVLKDYRKCCFCHEEGDGLTDGPARLLNLDLDLWVHLNCALWSTEVYETQAGALINVELALRRGLQMKCVFCHKMGATSGCHRLRCTNVYHFTCAIKAQCMFFKDKTMLCPMHKPKSTHEQELSYFAVFRRVYVQRDEVRQIASIVQRGDREHTFRVGSLIFHSIGQLLPHQMVAFHSSKVLYPVGFEASRLYWSIRYTNRRSRYLCSIEEKDGFPLFVIRVIEQGHEDMILTGLTPEDVWDKILEPVASIRKTSEMLQLFPVYLKGEDLFGLTVSAVARIAESLPGVEACERYTFRYGRNPLMELPLAINPTGCARSEPKMSSHVKRFVLRPHTLNSTSTSKSFQSTVTGELNAPYSKQFVHSKSSQYRKMKTEWKSNVYLARSRIQGLGLYAARDIEKHTMVIEYIGTIIRNEVANRKEKLYESQNRGVYMFRIDNDHVIDATLTGGPARYINHSCAPNCVAEVVTFERGHKIIISSNRRIQKGEELCYDYKFDFEDDQHKIACHCGAVNCRKWMN